MVLGPWLSFNFFYFSPGYRKSFISLPFSIFLWQNTIYLSIVLLSSVSSVSDIFITISSEKISLSNSETGLQCELVHGKWEWWRDSLQKQTFHNIFILILNPAPTEGRGKEKSHFHMASFLLCECSPQQILVDFTSLKSSGIPGTGDKSLSCLSQQQICPISSLNTKFL